MYACVQATRSFLSMTLDSKCIFLKITVKNGFKCIATKTALNGLNTNITFLVVVLMTCIIVKGKQVYDKMFSYANQGGDVVPWWFPILDLLGKVEILRKQKKVE